MNSYQTEKNAGPFYFTKKEWEAARYLEKIAEEAGLDVQISNYAFSVRAEYDQEGRLMLPSKYHDNIDKSIISSDIKVITFANVDSMIKRLKENGDVPLVLWGGEER